MRALPTPAAFLKHRAHAAPLATLYMTVCETTFMDGPVEMETRPARYVFSGKPDGFLVKRFTAPGGWCAALDCVEVK